MAATIVWFRNDLRLSDNRAIAAAIARGLPIVPVFIWAPEEDGAWPPGCASRSWLHGSLLTLDRDLRELGSALLILTGSSASTLKKLAIESGADAIYFGRLYEEYAVARDKAVSIELRKSGIAIESFNNGLLIEPWDIANNSKKPFRVFTHFWNRALQHLEACDTTPAQYSESIRAGHFLKSTKMFDTTSAASLVSLLPDATSILNSQEQWRHGNNNANETLQTFISEAMTEYSEKRDSLDVEATSRLSTYLHFGEIGPRQIWHALRNTKENREASASYLRQIGWREFAYHLIHHSPESSSRPLQAKFENFRWHRDETLLLAWKEGRTGYPVVDAGMRQLHQTGWISNRMRMIVASFLVKHLLVPWQDGAEHFWDKLIDADLANNTLGWQWVAGCGADAAPFFRIFNPVSQGEKFDPHGEYVRRWVPELKSISSKFIHKPWLASQSELDNAGVLLGSIYPRPIIEHDFARRRALEEFRLIRQS